MGNFNSMGLKLEKSFSVILYYFNICEQEGKIFQEKDTLDIHLRIQWRLIFANVSRYSRLRL